MDNVYSLLVIFVFVLGLPVLLIYRSSRESGQQDSWQPVWKYMISNWMGSQYLIVLGPFFFYASYFPLKYLLSDPPADMGTLEYLAAVFLVWASVVVMSVVFILGQFGDILSTSTTARSFTSKCAMVSGVVLILTLTTSHFQLLFHFFACGIGWYWTFNMLRIQLTTGGKDGE